MAPRRPTPAQIRERRSKIAVVVLGVVFAGVGVIQGPKVLKMLSGGSSPAAVAAQTPLPTPLAPGTPVSFTGAQVTVGAVSTRQLPRFTLMAVKDPFHSLLPIAPASGPTGPTGATAPPPAAATTTQTTTTTTTTTPKTPPPPTQPPAATQPAAPPVLFASTPSGPLVATALVQINGHRLTVAVGGAFPRSSPLFRLVSLGKNRVQIHLVGGSFADGSQAMKLLRGGRVTMVDSTDGSRFVIQFVRLKKVSADAVTIPAPAPKTTTGPSVPPVGSTTPTG